MRTGIGYDVHRFEKGRKLILGGVEIPYEKGLLGHSDADALLHAVTDALLGAAGLGDIGSHCPDSDPKYKGADSLLLLKETVRLLSENGFRAVNIDCTVVAEEPKISPYKEQMRENIAKVCALPPDAVNVKGKTEEGLGFTGKKLGVKALATCLITEIR